MIMYMIMLKSQHHRVPGMVAIVPISEMRNTAKMFEMSENEPVYITRNGYGSRVLMNIETYNRLKDIMLDMELEEAYQRSETDGRNTEARAFLQRLRNE